MTVTRRIGGSLIRVIQGDITEIAVDAIVNAANPSLLGGGGVDGAIHRVGGASILEECRRIGGCATGEAVVTGAGALPARWVIHTVGPVWRGGEKNEPEQLESAYRESMKRGREISAGRLAFPSISTGAYGYPLDEAAAIAVATAIKVIEEYNTPEELFFVAFDQVTFKAYQKALDLPV